VYIQCETKVSWKCPTWGSPISWNFSGSFWTESFTICCKEFHESKFCESWMLNKVICFYNLSFCILFFKTVILSWNFRETRLVFCL
jgi:hypothetical protein